MRQVGIAWYSQVTYGAEVLPYVMISLSGHDPDFIPPIALQCMQNTSTQQFAVVETFSDYVDAQEMFDVAYRSVGA